MKGFTHATLQLSEQADWQAMRQRRHGQAPSQEVASLHKAGTWQAHSLSLQVSISILICLPQREIDLRRCFGERFEQIANRQIAIAILIRLTM
jgi:hypothetical protein